MLKPRKNTDFFYWKIYLKGIEPGLCSVACESSYYLWEKMEIWKRNTWYENLFCSVVFIYAGIGDNTLSKDTCSKQPIKTLSKCRNKYRNIKSIKHNHNFTIWQILFALILLRNLFNPTYVHREKKLTFLLRNSIKLCFKESATAGFSQKFRKINRKTPVPESHF